MSWIAALDEPRRSETLGRVATLVEQGQTPAQLPFHVRVGLAELCA
jgi:hypothetical protein